MPARRKSAFSAVLKEAQTHNGEEGEQQHRETVKPQESGTASLQYRETAEQLYSNAVTPFKGETVEQLEKVTFYLTAEQAERLDDLAHDYKKRTGQRINRNDVVRYLIDQATLDSLEGMKRHTRKPGQK